MSYSYDSKTNYWPGHTRLKQIPVQNKLAPAGFSYYDILMSEHGGTHIDAPKHFYEKGKHLNEVLLDEPIGPAVVVDISAQTAKDQDYQLSVGDLEAWEEKHGKIPDGAILFLYSGRGKDWANPDKFLGYDPKLNKTGYGYLHNPGKAKIVSNVCTISLFSSPHVAASSILFSCYITLGSQVVHMELRGVLYLTHKDWRLGKTIEGRN